MFQDGSQPPPTYSVGKGQPQQKLCLLYKLATCLLGPKPRHAALKHLGTLKDPRGIAARWIEKLAGYQFNVQHKAGVQNSNADGLSRAPQLDPPDPVMESEEATYVGAMGKTGPEEIKSVHIMMTPNSIAGEADGPQEDTTALEEGSLERQNLIRVQKRDPVLRMVHTWTKEGPPLKEAARGLPCRCAAVHPSARGHQH